MEMICISSMGESAQSYVESTTVLSDDDERRGIHNLMHGSCWSEV